MKVGRGRKNERESEKGGEKESERNECSEGWGH